MLRDDVLLLLTEAEGYLSGEEMREKLGVSRAAVSQAVRALRADGYDIDAVTNRGYCLRARPDTLTAGDVLSYLPEARRAMVRCFAQIDSTNSYLTAGALRGARDGLCAIADRQTAGRGRAGRPFRSDAGQGVYLSMLLRPNCAPTAAMTMTAHVAVAVCRALEACGVQPGIKWTNDLVLGTKKLCGILTELTVEAETGTVDSIVAGIGVNVRQRPEDFPPELRTIAGSVRSETGLEISRARLAAESCDFEDVFFVDSRTASQGEGILIREALRLRDEEHLPAHAIVAELEQLKQRIRILAVVDSLKHLHKGGRLPAAVALVGGALGVKPVLSVVDGQIKLADTARGRPGAFVAMFKNIEKMGGVDPRYGYALLYSDEKGVLAPLHHYMHENLHMTGGHVARLGPVIASHAGPGCAGLVFVTKE